MKRVTTAFSIVIMLLDISASAQWTSIWTNNNINGSCYAVNADTFFVTGGGGIIYRTLNGGTSWDSAQSIFTTSWYNHINFSSPTVGYACGGTAFGQHSSTIAKTTDGGQTWDSLTSNTF